MSSDADSKPTSHQRVYGRGMFAGLKLAGISNPGEFMNKQKLQKQIDSLNGVAQKVFDAMPPAEAVDIRTVMQALHKSGYNLRHEVVLGCLSTMVDKGLVKEKARGQFSRVIAREFERSSNIDDVTDDGGSELLSLPVDGFEDDINDKPATDANQHASGEISVHPLERLAQLESKVRALSSEFSQRIAAVTEEIADVALDVGQYVDNVKRENQKLSLLKDALRGFVN